MHQQQFEVNSKNYDILVQQQQHKLMALQQLLEAYNKCVSLLCFIPYSSVSSELKITIHPLFQCEFRQIKFAEFTFPSVLSIIILSSSSVSSSVKYCAQSCNEAENASR